MTDVQEAAQAALERFDGDSLRLSFVIGRKSRWIVEMLPQPEKVAERLQANGWAEGEITPDLVEAYAHEPVARAEGATKTEAIRELQPVPWKPDVRHVVVKVLRPEWRPGASEEDCTFIAWVQGEKASRSLPFDRRIVRHCAESGKAYYHATVKSGTIKLGSRLMDQDW